MNNKNSNQVPENDAARKSTLNVVLSLLCGSVKYRILEKNVDGEQKFYAQYKKLFFWKTIRSESQKLWCVDGGVQTKYTAEVWIANHKKSEPPPVIHFVR